MKTPTPSDIYNAIIHAAKHQIKTAEVSAKLEKLGLMDEVRSLIETIAANAANPIVIMLEDELDRVASQKHISKTD